jgi:DegV family protein with EDD domain
MSSICILTDNSAQFSHPAFPGHDFVRIIPYEIEYNHQVYGNGKELKTNMLPAHAGEDNHPCLRLPSKEAYFNILQELSRNFEHIIVLVISSQLSASYETAVAAANNIHGRSEVTVIDTRTTSAGLGFLVQKAAELVLKGQDTASIVERIRRQIPHVYTLLSTQVLSYLYYNNFIDQAQSVVGEMLGVFPIFTLEEGKLVAIEKQRNQRSVMDYFLEFLDEFDNLEHIAFIQSFPPTNTEIRVFRQHVDEVHPNTPFSEHSINPPLATLMGPKTIGLIVAEAPDN